MDTKDYARITNDSKSEAGNKFSDVAGQHYTYQDLHAGKLKVGTKVVYHHVSGNGVESHYFGIAEIGEIMKTPDGNNRAIMKEGSYHRFDVKVPIKRKNGTYYEGNSSVFQSGVRNISKEVYDEIVSNGKSTTPAGVLSGLTIDSASSEFESKKFKVVANKKGYYLVNLHDNTYYPLIEENIGINSTSLTIKILKNASGVYVIMVNGSPKGYLTLFDKGIIFESASSKKVTKKIYL